MNPEPSPSGRQAGRALVFIYLFLILLFSLMQIVGAYCQDTKPDKARKTENTWDMQLSFGSDDQGISADFQFRIR